MFEVSLIIPVYKAESFLDATLNSIITNPAFEKIEVVLVNDGSPDKSGEIIDSYAQKYANIFAYHKQNGGVSSARNLGIEKATTDCVLFLDSDDVLADGIPELIEASKTADLAVAGFTSAKSQDSKLVPLSTVVPAKKQATTKNEIRNVYFDNFQNKLFLTSCGKIYKKQILTDNGLKFNQNQIIGEDGNFVQEYVRHVNSIACVDKSAFYYMLDATASATKKVNTKHFDDMKVLYSRLIDFANVFEATDDQREIVSNYYFRSCCFFVEGIPSFASGKDYIKKIITDKTIIELSGNTHTSKENIIYSVVFKTKSKLLLYMFCKLRKVLKQLIAR